LDFTEILVALISAASGIGAAYLASKARNTSVKRAAKRNGWEELLAHMEREAALYRDQLKRARHEITIISERFYEVREEATVTEIQLNERIKELERRLHEIYTRSEGEGEQGPK
jgi:hypothetical protein